MNGIGGVAGLVISLAIAGLIAWIELKRRAAYRAGQKSVHQETEEINAQQLDKANQARRDAAADNYQPGRLREDDGFRRDE